ncbi:MAG: 2-C-methyl-D-erythritol 4-phosphate cytidylyltransferase [Methanocorpusculum sp.]|nr:2-C-methyl-D-erythritol 4-phosphate cytidylyltransferase [Methanocorpusculum sp.]
MKSIGIVLAGGLGQRFGGDKPKQYFKILGREMIAYSIDLFRNAKTIDDFVVVLNPEEFENGRIEKEYGVHVVRGGVTRNWSFKNALDYIARTWPDCEKVIENNAACPLTKSETIDEYIQKLDEYDWVQTTIKITDALGSYKDRTVDREDYFLIQAPDAYRFKEIYRHFDPNHSNGHPAAQLPTNARGFNAFYNGPVFKVTHPDDIFIVEALLLRERRD